VGVFLFVRRSLLHQLDRELGSRLTMVERALLDEPDEVDELADHGTVAIFRVARNGRVVYRSEGWRRLGLSGAGGGPPGVSFWSWRAPSGQPWRLARGVATVRGNTYRLTVATDETQPRQSLRLLLVILLAGFPAALALALGGGYFLAGRVLSPVADMAATARRITAERLSERLPIANAHDEFGRLATVFNETLARLEESFENLRRFTADASHELRTPLTAIRSVGEVGLQEPREAAAYRETIGSMLEETDRLARLVDSLLVLSRADSGRVTLTRERLNLAALATEVVECLRVLAEEKEQSLVSDLEPAWVVADAPTLRMALLNLVDNAIKYSGAGCKIRVRCYRDEKSLVLAVDDSGAGLNSDEHEKVLGRFYRAADTNSRGAGLGLSIVKSIAQIHSAQVELGESDLGGLAIKVRFDLGSS